MLNHYLCTTSLLFLFPNEGSCVVIGKADRLGLTAPIVYYTYLIHLYLLYYVGKVLLQQRTSPARHSSYSVGMLIIVCQWGETEMTIELPACVTTPLLKPFISLVYGATVPAEL